jgi:thioredoxin 2
MADEITRCPSCGRRNRVRGDAAGTTKCGNCHAPLPWIVDAGDANFVERVQGAAVPVLVDFWAPWCGPCRTVSPALEQLAGDTPGKLKLVKVNVDSAPGLQQKLGIQSIPTLMVFRDGQVIARQTGAAPVAALRSWLNQSLATPADARGA